jgi:starch-binding outer membrane protein, SusD/RagB family
MIMKTRLNIYTILSTISLLFTGISCGDSFLDQPPYGSYSGPQVQNKNGIEGILINAYAALNGITNPANFNATWGSGSTNWIWGGMRSDDSYIGTEEKDQTNMLLTEKYAALPSFDIILSKWQGTWDGIGQANAVLSALKTVDELSDDDRIRIEGEARFLRGHFYFEAVKHWLNVPYVDENTVDFKVSNLGVDIWPKIEADFQFAYDNLPEGGGSYLAGRANKWAAASFLAKAYIFERKWQDAENLLDIIIAQGKTSKGEAYGLNNRFSDNFNAATENTKESVFAIQHSIGVPGGQGMNGNYDMVLAYPHNGGPGGGCCGFFQPSHNLVNSYKVDGNGLPLLDTFNDVDFVDPDDNFSYVYTGTVDVRLDHTVGRMDIPYLDYGVFDNLWIRNPTFGGPYLPKKNVYPSNGPHETGGWGEQSNAINYNIIRFADVLLWKAEAAIENGDWAGDGLAYINMVRARAAMSENLIPESPATYNTGLYPSFQSQDHARAALRFERKIEFAMEGHRFYDLLRWDAGGTLDIVNYINNEYLSKETLRRPHLTQPVAVFEDCDKYLPIPAQAISNSSKEGEPTLVQISGCY